MAKQKAQPSPQGAEPAVVQGGGPPVDAIKEGGTGVASLATGGVASVGTPSSGEEATAVRGDSTGPEAGAPSGLPPVDPGPAGQAVGGVLGAASAESSPNGEGTTATGGVPDALVATDPVPQQVTSEKVLALVLSDGPFGRCGEVREFDAAHAAEIEAGGFIDTHPNAVASADKD